MRIDSSGNVGIGTGSPGRPLHVHQATGGGTQMLFTNSTTSSASNRGAEFGLGADEQAQIWLYENSYFRLATNNTERMRIDSSGRVGIMVSNPGSYYLHGSDLVVGGDTGSHAGITIKTGSSDQGILCFADGTTGGTQQYAGYLLYDHTTDTMRIATGSVERMRVENNGQVSITHNSSGAPNLFLNATDSAYATNVQQNRVSRAANSGFVFLSCRTNAGGDIEFNLRGDGSAYADGTWNGGGADYAEFFEWSDGNTSAEDRRGISVVLDGDKIREATAGEEPIGVISGNPSVVGDADMERWKNKYLRDEYGTYDLDENGDRKLNPDYNPDAEYVSRENRPEWDTVGLMGKIRIRKGQVTGSRWVKMRDINDSVEEWLVR